MFQAIENNTDWNAFYLHRVKIDRQGLSKEKVCSAAASDRRSRVCGIKAKVLGEAGM